MKFDGIATFSAIAFSLLFTIYGFNHFEAYGQAENKTFDIAAVGDIGCGVNGAKTISSIQTNGPDLVIFLGDLSYKPKFDCFFTQIKV